jgi:SAM-dependent methyltransferase
MQDRFTYVTRTTCVCGEQIDTAPVKVTKATSWGPVRFVECAACASVVQSPQIAPESLAEWFSSPRYYEAAGQSAGGPYLDYLADEAQRQREAHGRYDRELRGLLPDRANVLEVGSATGSMLAVLARHGHQVTGIDLSKPFVEAAKRLNGVSVVRTNFLEYRPEAAFDMIIMLGTVSNFPDIGDAFRHCHALLRPGGQIYFNTPLAGSWPARVYGARFWMYSPSCSTLLSRRACTLVVERAGFRVTRIGVDRQMPSLAKLAGHLRMRPLYALLKSLRLAHRTPGFAWPVPGIVVVVARKAATL